MKILYLTPFLLLCAGCVATSGELRALADQLDVVETVVNSSADLVAQAASGQITPTELVTYVIGSLLGLGAAKKGGTVIAKKVANGAS